MLLRVERFTTILRQRLFDVRKYRKVVEIKCTKCFFSYLRCLFFPFALLANVKKPHTNRFKANSETFFRICVWQKLLFGNG